MSKLYYMVAACLLLAISARGQGVRSGTEDTLKTRILKVFEYKPTVSDAKKLALMPEVRDTVVPKPGVTYISGVRQFITSYTPDSIRAASMKGEPLEPLQRAYVRGGAGNGINYLFDAYLNALRSRKGALGLEVHGKGTQGVLTDLPPAPYNRWSAALSGKRFLKKHELTSSLGYDRERIQYYGYSYSDTLLAPLYWEYQGNEDVFRQVYSEVYGNIGIKSFYTDSTKLNHSAQLHYDHFFDRNAANREHNVVADGRISRYLGQHLGSADFLADFNAVNYVAPFYYPGLDSISAQSSNAILGITPKITSQSSKWRLEIGVKAQMNVRANQTDLRLYPDVYARFNLVKEVIIPYAGITGGLQRNNLNKLSDMNPFLWTALIPLQNTDRQYHIYGGFRGAVSKRFTYNIHGGQFHEAGAPLFVNYNASRLNPGLSDFGVNYFMVEYDTITTIEIGGELTYRVGEKLHVLATGVFRDYTTRAEVQAWHRPVYEVHATGTYRLANKIIAKADVHLLGPQTAKGFKTYIPDDPESMGTEFFNGVPMSVTATSIKPIFDMSLGVEYRYTERLSAFLNMNNLIAQRYQRWNRYPVQRFNVMAGITYAFWRE